MQRNAYCEREPHTNLAAISLKRRQRNNNWKLPECTSVPPKNLGRGHQAAPFFFFWTILLVGEMASATASPLLSRLLSPHRLQTVMVQQTTLSVPPTLATGAKHFCTSHFFTSHFCTSLVEPDFTLAVTGLWMLPVESASLRFCSMATAAAASARNSSRVPEAL